MIKAYQEGKGSVDFIIENVMASSYEDEPRFLTMINEAIQSGSVELYPQWKKDTSKKAIKARRAAAEKEAKEAEELSKELGYDKPLTKLDEGELGRLIRAKQANSMNGLLEKLEKQASSRAGRKGKRKEPTEEEFEAARARIEARKKKAR